MNKTKIRTYAEQDDNPPVQKSLRPQSLAEYIGQDNIKQSVAILIRSAKIRNEQPPHILFYGPPGLGKTTLANIIANELDQPIVTTVGNNLERPADIASLLNNIQENSIVFIDEIHRINKIAEESLYSAMEDGFLTITVGTSEQAKTIKLSLPKFTLIGATTRAGMISAPLRDRFTYQYRMEPYSSGDLNEIARLTSEKLGITLNDEDLSIISSASRGIPRLVNQYCILVRDFATANSKGMICADTVGKTLKLAGIRKNGFTETDTKILKILYTAGKPVGLTTLSQVTGEDEQTIEDMIEPYLLSKTMIIKTPRGREITPEGISYVEELYQSEN